MGKAHKCKSIRNIDCVFIQTLNGQGWFWHHVENLNKVTCHEIKFCPYCGQELEGG